MAKPEAAPKDGIQVKDGVRYRAVQGEPMYPGAKFEEAPAKGAKAKATGKGKKSSPGPDETTEGLGPSETS